MIPRAFHWVWLGDQPLPVQFRTWIDGWTRLHPDWEHTIWTDANRPALRNEQTFFSTTVPAQRADILRYELVHRFGGVYLDTDMECLCPIDDLLVDVDAFAGEEEPGQIGNSVIGASPEHPWINDVIERLPESMQRHQDIPAASGPVFLTEVTRDHPEVTIFPPAVFCPYRAHEPSRAGGPFPGAYAVHRWHGSWVDPEDKFMEDFPRELERELRDLLPPDARVITLAEGIELDLGEHPTLPFTEREGFWGNPENSVQALTELQRLRARGWDWLVLLEDAYWWFDLYADFLGAVEREARSTHRRRRFTAFELPRN